MSNYSLKLSLHEVVQRIESLNGLPARRSGTRYILRCPSHDDNNPSLSICQSINGLILLHCFAGCSFFDICTSLGIHPVSLFPEDRS